MLIFNAIMISRRHLISKAKIIVEHCSLSNKSPHKAVWTATQMMMVMMMIFIEQQGEQIRKTPTRDHKRLGDQWRPTSKNLEETDLARGCQSWYRYDIMIKFYQSNPVTVRFVISQRYGNQKLDSFSIALYESWKMSQKVCNFENIFLHGCWC